MTLARSEDQGLSVTDEPLNESVAHAHYGCYRTSQEKQMGLSLDLVFDRYGKDRQGDGVLAYNRLAFGDVDPSLRAVLKEVGVPLSEGIQWLDDEAGLVPMKTDDYGNTFTFVSAALLAPRLSEAAKNPWAQAVASFVEALPSDTRIVLRWH